MGTATLAIAFEGTSWTDPNALTLELMRNILGSFTTSSGLGSNVSSSMCQEVAQHSLASSIKATAPDNKLDDLLWYVMPNLVRLAHGVSDEELARAKMALRRDILADYDGNIAHGEVIARQL